MDTRKIGMAVRRAVTHPLTLSTGIGVAAVSISVMVLLTGQPVLMAWVVLALSAGFAISGSV